MKKIFKIWVESFSYDDYDAYVVTAESREEVIDAVNLKSRREDKNKDYNSIFLPSYGKIHSGKQEIHIEEIGSTERYDEFTIILSSFNAG